MNKNIILLYLWCFVSHSTLIANSFYVALNGIASNNGSYNLPWDIVTAFNHPATLRPGDTLWIRGGRYFGTDAVNQNTVSGFLCNINGTKDNPIVIRVYPGERAILDGGNRPHPVAPDPNFDSYTLGVLGSNLCFWGLEFCNSNMSSRSDSTAGFRWRVRGVVSAGTRLRFINNLFYDLGNGIEAFSGCEECEYYGNIVFNNGWSHLGVRGHGEGMYAQNVNFTKTVKDNIFFNQFDHGLIIYGSSQSTINNFKIIGNIVFGNGTPNDDPNGWGFLFGKSNQSSGRGMNFEIRQNYLYNRFDYQRSNNMDLSYQSGLSDVILTDNYSVGRNAIKYNIPILNFTSSNNTFIGEVTQIPLQQVDNGMNEIRSSQNLPTINAIFIRPNDYESGRAHIVIYNWENKKMETVDLNQIGLNDGDAYEIYDVQNILGEPVIKGIYNAANTEITLPMDLTQVTPVIGEGVPRQIKHTDPVFNTFLVKKRLNTTGVSNSNSKRNLLVKEIINVGDKIAIHFFESGFFQIKLVDLFGRTIHSCETQSNFCSIESASLFPGLYALELNRGRDKQIIKINL